jgi:HflK protein
VFLIAFLVSAAQQTFWVLYEGALFILIGFAVAGAVHVLLDPDRIVRYLGERSLKAAAIAALLGAPIPLCSCGVLPMAMLLRRKGASRESTLSFLVTTPETGIDSIAITLAFFGPLFAIVRPLVAVVTGLVAAFVSLRRGPQENGTGTESDPVPEPSDPHHHADHETAEMPPTDAPLLHRAEAAGRRATRFAFVELFDELGFWLALAILLTGVLSALLPPDFFSRIVPSSFAAMLVMVVLSIPLYVCASASTPLAALFVAKGASAGAALVFLLVGPATNAASIAAVARLFGRSFVRVYLGSIIGVAVAAGLLLDLLLPDLRSSVAIGAPEGPEYIGVLKLIAALVLAWLLFDSLRRTGLRPGLSELGDNARAATRWLRGLRLRAVLTSRAAQGLALIWVLVTLAGGFSRVPIGERAIVQRFGALAGSPREPGLVFAAPLIDRVELVRVDEVRQGAIGYRIGRGGTLAREPVLDEALYVTADENVIDLHAEVQYRVSDPVRFRLGVEAPAEVLSALVRARLVEAMASRAIDFVYTSDRAEVEGWLLEHVRRDVEQSALGIDVLAVRLLDVHAPASVHDAFRDVASAHEDRLTTIHQANEYAAGVVAVARGEAVRLIAEAEGQATERVAQATGAAAAFTALAAEHQRAPRLTEDRLYLEASERVLPGARKVIRPTAGAAKGYELWLRGSGTATVFPPPPGAAGAGSAPATQPTRAVPAPQEGDSE